MAERKGVPLQVALLALVAAAFLAGMVPAGMVLERWVARELEARVRADLALAPRLLADRNAAVGDAVMMHAKDVAHAAALAPAVAGGDRAAAVRAAEDVARTFHSGGVVAGPDGAAWSGPRATPQMMEATRRGEMPVEVLADSSGMYLVSIAPVQHAGAWAGAAGVAVPLDEAAAGALAGLTRSDLVVVTLPDGRLVASPADHPVAAAFAGGSSSPTYPGVYAMDAESGRYLHARGPMKGATVFFVRDLRREHAILGPLRRALAFTGAGALALALLLGAVLARGIARPVRVLASAAGSVSRGDFGAPLAASPVREVAAVTGAFGSMRSALAVRIEELRTANRLLEERQARLTALQSELIQRERVAAGGRVAAELAHEIRNPVASLRNCLELLQRRLVNDPEGREYAALAIDELLRMHELAERMLHLNRPRDPAVGRCDAAEVAREVAALSGIGAEGRVEVSVAADGPAPAAIPPDALKQVLINLVQNARDAVPRGLVMEIIVRREDGGVRVTTCDNGPGIPQEIRRRVFDPFFTTRATAGGVGLGLFVVEGVVRGHGGTVSVDDAPGGGACFRITLPAAVDEARAPSAAPAAAEAVA